jgi:putative tricarboxylic transport membrane protein
MAHNENTAQGVARTVVVDIVVAAIIFVLGALVAWDSYRLGASWASDGPEAGYFPFRIGALICICATVVIVQGLLRYKTDRTAFVGRTQFRQVLVILLPSTVYVFGVWLIGIYVSSALFIALFMKFAGRYTWLRSVVVGLGVSVTAFVLFEMWFKIPLPKGPFERLIGF